MITKYHAKYYATVLSNQAIGGQIDSLSQSLLNAAVDINPHQIEAALFAFQSPLSKGVIFADEVGLGKTIEAGLVLCQYWAVGKRKIIVICPASIRKQWGYELTEKFGIENEVLDARNYRDYERRGLDPLDQKKVVICSYNFAARKKDEIKRHGFDFAIIDEAHKLRNVYKKKAKTAQAIKEALSDVKKLLLTATPFQNSLMELFGLTSVVDDNIFGDARSFRAEYVYDENLSDLRQRLLPYYKRTLRRDVREYINYTNRLPITQQFDATDLESKLYEDVSEFLRREDIYSVPKRQRMLTTMIIRKILASSTYALIGTLRTVKARLEQMLNNEAVRQLTLADYMDEDEAELYEEDDDEENLLEDEKIDLDKLREEIHTIEGFIETALKIQHDSKSEALLQALDQSFQMLPKTGAKQKALIFTESTRTQQYLKDYLNQHGYAGKIVTFNGSNNDPDSNAIYDAWLSENAYNGKASGIKAADKRVALVEHFRDEAEIMIATEAAAEGLNLQFCSLVVNYDLPWNPQRIEQRIGRCHRYGQKCDVVVVNFVNRRNYADVRVYNLLLDKFHLFDDVFGASDDVLGQADAIDFEKRIWEIYQECRTEAEINAAFEKLQQDLQDQINEKMKDVREQVLEHFDIGVQERLKLAKSETGAFLNRYEHIFWELTKYILGKDAEFDDETHAFRLLRPIVGCRTGKYELLSCVTDGIPYRLSHPLAQYVLQTALSLQTEDGAVTFRENDLALKVTLPDYLKNQSGYLVLSHLAVSAFDDEQYCLFTAFTKDGRFLTQEDCEKLFLCGGAETVLREISPEVRRKLGVNSVQHTKSKLQQIDSRNLEYFRDEEERIFRWEKDLIESIERELDIVKRAIREQERLSRSAANMEEKLAITKKIDELERQKRKKRNELADREDEVSAQRRRMIEELDRRKVQKTATDDIFVIAWNVVS
ncbi:MAG: DEAD/DEAH box helicase family protein [Oscillospiraceae bacterium]|nr:DEAD/DEAH box helicase family protein [Oscillospiraceae bacterium]MBQ9046173.1 DEAD/DEAH box helicase family protein [Oscillospiraceae bacterium]